MTILETKELRKVYGDGETAVHALDGVTLTVEKGEFVAVVGTSGSGKSTLLHMLGGLDRPTSGTVRIDGKDIFSLKDEALTIFRRRKIGFVFQNFNLVPVLSVRENIALPVQLDGREPDAAFLKGVVETLGLSEKLESLPDQLSGGQQQRVGVARALAADPEVLLMDEPFGALDPVTRGALQQEMLRIHRLSGRTIVLVTHDIDEALALADRLVLMDGGEIVQQGKPVELLTQPKTPFVRDFFGRSELGVRLLALGQVGMAARRGEWLEGEAIVASLTLREALSQFISRQTDKLPVVDERQQPLGVLHFADLLRQREVS